MIYLLLRYALRFNQIRYLDSGELDHIRYFFETGTFSTNPSSRAIEGRAMGILQPGDARDAVEGLLNINLQVAINKVRVQSARHSSYLIADVDDAVVWVIKEVLDWQVKHGAPPQLVRESDAPDAYMRGISRNENIRRLLPEICCLFREPTQKGIFPPAYGSVLYFWGLLCRRWDLAQAEVPGGADTLPSRKCGVPQLSKMVGRTVRPNFGLHTLRVTGITDMLDREIPPAIVSSVVGHSSTAMTFYYYKPNKRNTRIKLSQAMNSGDVSDGLESIDRQLYDLKNPRKFLLGSPTAFTAIEKAQRQGKLWNISLTGICPGASCDEGLDWTTRGGTSIPVPGSRCPFCRFRLYGPAFLPGMIQEYNHLLYTLSETAKKQRELREKAEAADHSKKFKDAMLFRDEDEELGRGTEIDVEHLARLHAMIKESTDSLNQKPSGESTFQFSLITQGDTKIGAAVERVGQFESLKEILETADILPATKSPVPDRVLAVFQNQLMAFLYKNGITPYLAGIPAEMMRPAALQLARLLENSIPNRSQRESIFSGMTPLAALGNGSEVLRRSIACLSSQASFDGTGPDKGLLA
jgi:hypothetical protein